MTNLPKGFRGAAIAAGLKSNGALDLTLIENMGPRFDAAAEPPEEEEARPRARRRRA